MLRFSARFCDARQSTRMAMALLACCALAACATSPPPQQKPLDSAMSLRPAAQKPAAPLQLSLEDVGTPPDPAASVALPPAFVGCWVGTIHGNDYTIPIGFLSSLAVFATETYHFCYLQDPKNGKADLVMRDLVVNHQELVVSEFENQTVWTDGRGTAFLRNHFAMTQPPLGFSHFPRQEIYSDESVTMENPDLLKMRAVEVIKRSGSDYIRAAFHADFHRAPMPPHRLTSAAAATHP